jgi:hypothetical protein
MDGEQSSKNAAATARSVVPRLSHADWSRGGRTSPASGSSLQISEPATAIGAAGTNPRMPMTIVVARKRPGSPRRLLSESSGEESSALPPSLLPVDVEGFYHRDRDKGRCRVDIQAPEQAAGKSVALTGWVTTYHLVQGQGAQEGLTLAPIALRLELLQ